jgi:hypothetical protein
MFVIGNRGEREILVMFVLGSWTSRAVKTQKVC